MAKRELTKAQIILEQAKNRLHLARETVEAARRNVEKAQAVFEAQLEAYEALQAALERKKPVRRQRQAETAPQIVFDPSCGPACGICGLPQEHFNHDLTYLSSHPFAEAATVVPVEKKSRKKRSGASSEANTQTSTADAMTAPN